MSESPRLLFMNQAATVLRGMTGTRYWGGAYAQAPTVEVGEDRLYQEVATQLPWIGLLPAPGSQTDLETQRGHDHLLFDQFRVLLYGYVEGDGTTNRTTWLLRLVRDIQQTLKQTSAFAALRPGTAFAYAVSLDFEVEDLAYYAGESQGAEFSLPLLVRIPDDLTT